MRSVFCSYSSWLLFKSAQIFSCAFLSWLLLVTALNNAHATEVTNLIKVEENIKDLILLKKNDSIYSDKNKDAAIKIEVISTDDVTIEKGIIINGIADGTNKLSSQAAVPALLICGTADYSANLTINNNLTIGKDALLITDATAALLINNIKKVTTDIYNAGTITGETCIQIGDSNRLYNFILDGTLTNSGTIKSKKLKNSTSSGNALVISGKKRGIKQFQFANSGTVDGNLKFISNQSSPYFNYILTNDGTITTDNFVMKNVKTIIKNNKCFNIKEVDMGSAEIFLENEGSITLNSVFYVESVVNNGTLTITGVNNAAAYVRLFTNTSMAIFNEITLEGITSNCGIMDIKVFLGTSAKLENKKGGIINVRHGDATFSRLVENGTNCVINVGTIARFNGNVRNYGLLNITNDLLTADSGGSQATFINEEHGIINVKERQAIFNNNIINSGTITIKQFLKTANGITFTNNKHGVVYVTNGYADFYGSVTNYGLIKTANGDELTAFNNDAVINAGIISVNNGLITKNNVILTNQTTGIINVTAGKAVFTGEVTNSGLIKVNDDVVEFNDIVTNYGTITAGNGLKIVSNQFTNNEKAIVTIDGDIAEFKDVTINYGIITANKGLTTGIKKFTNNEKAIVTIDGDIAEFKDVTINYGIITANKGLTTGIKKFTNQAKAIVEINGDIAKFKGDVTNYGTITASKGLTIANSTTFTNTGIIDIIGKASFTVEVKNSGLIQVSDNVVEFNKSVINDNTINANKGLITATNTSFTNNAKAIVKIDGGIAKFNGSVINDNIINANKGLITATNTSFTNNAKAIVKIDGGIAKFNGSLISDSTITSGAGLTITNFENKISGFLDAAEETNFNGIVINNGTIIANKGLIIENSTTFTNYPNSKLILSSAFTNKGISTIEKLKISNKNINKILQIINADKAQIKINKPFNTKDGVVDVINDGCLSIIAESFINSYTGSGEIVIILPEDLTKISSKGQSLLTVAKNVTFTKDAKIILQESNIGFESPLRLKPTRIKIVQASNITLVANTKIDDFLYSNVKAKSCLLYITNAKITKTEISADIQQKNIKKLNFDNCELITSLLGEHSISAEKQKKIIDTSIIQINPKSKDAVKNLKKITQSVSANIFMEEVSELIETSRDLEIAGMKISEIFIAFDKASNDSVHKNKLKAILDHAGQNAKNKDEFLDYIIPDSSNSKLNSSVKIGNNLTSHINSRINSKSMNTNKVKSINYGAITYNVDVWTAVSFIAGKEFTTKTDRSDLNAKSFSFGVDTTNANDMFLGLSYGFSKSNVKIYSSKKNMLKGEDNISTNAVSVYAANNLSLWKLQLSLLYAHSKHRPEKLAKIGNSSNILGINTAFIYPFPDLSLIGKLNFTQIRIDKHEDKHMEIPKKITNLATTGIGIAFNGKLSGSNDVVLDYNITLNHNFIWLLNRKTKTINIIPSNNDTAININQLEPNNYSADINILLKLQISKEINLNLNLNCAIGRNNYEYSTNFIIHYLF